jgi:predicted  nucleic acid-binding Zn-ribbon protein
MGARVTAAPYTVADLDELLRGSRQTDADKLRATVETLGDARKALAVSAFAMSADRVEMEAERDAIRARLDDAERDLAPAANAVVSVQRERDDLRGDLLEAVTLLSALWRAVPGSETPDLVARVERALGAR